MVGVAAQEHGEMGHGLLDLPDQMGVGLLIRMRHLHRVCADTGRQTPVANEMEPN